MMAQILYLQEKYDLHMKVSDAANFPGRTKHGSVKKELQGISCTGYFLQFLICNYSAPMYLRRY